MDYTPMEGKNISVCLFTVATATCHRYPTYPLQTQLGSRWRSRGLCVWHSKKEQHNQLFSTCGSEDPGL